MILCCSEPPHQVPPTVGRIAAIFLLAYGPVSGTRVSWQRNLMTLTSKLMTSVEGYLLHSQNTSSLPCWRASILEFLSSSCRIISLRHHCLDVLAASFHSTVMGTCLEESRNSSIRSHHADVRNFSQWCFKLLKHGTCSRCSSVWRPLCWDVRSGSS